MATTFLLIRHAQNDWIGKAFAGRQPGVHLNADGRRQAEALSLRLAGAGIRAIYSSPLERALETVEPLAVRLGLPVHRRERLTELGTGDWTGCSFDDLSQQLRWARFNRLRSTTRPPEGELMTEIQARMTAELEELRGLHPGEAVAVVSHADVIRAALALYMGVPIDLCHRLEINPASVSTLVLGDEEIRIVGVNDTGRLL